MPLAVIDTNEHFTTKSLDLLQRGRHCLGKSIRVFTDASYKADTDPESGGLGIFLESDAKGLAAKMDISAHFPHCYQDNKAQPLLLPPSLGTNVLLMELVALYKALEWVCHTHTRLTRKDEVNVFVDSLLSLFLLRSFSQDPTLPKTMRRRSLEERTLLQDVILPVLHSIDEVTRTLKCDVILHKVKAHQGIHGNEMADRLAKMGRCLQGRNGLEVYDTPDLPTLVKRKNHRLQPMPYGKPIVTPCSRPKMPPTHISVVPALTMLPIC